ncbi:hypothetical protein BGZ92_003086 [Podila epicladia]|nr:hypothetical protein BGZ92_003086 [Podila epicladia]
MAIAGVHLEPVLADSAEFTKYEEILELDLVKLYKLGYNGTTPRNLSGPEWSDIRFFHGTGHCECVDRSYGM